MDLLHVGTNVTISTQDSTGNAPNNLTVSEQQNGSGDITVSSDIRVPASSSNVAKLSLIAERNIIVEASDSADSIRIQNLQTGSSNGEVFSFEAKNDITIDGIISNFGGGDGKIVLKAGRTDDFANTGRSDSLGNININALIDAYHGGIDIDGNDVTITDANLVAGGDNSVGNKVQINHNVKIQNNVSVYEGVELEDYVFCGPSMVFTNIKLPRSEFPQRGSQFYKKTLIKKSASIGANATIVCGVTIGEYAMIGSGTVITKDIPPFSLVVVITTGVVI